MNQMLANEKYERYFVVWKLLACYDQSSWFFSRTPQKHKVKTLITPRKINIEPENFGLEDDFPFPEVYSQVPC